MYAFVTAIRPKTLSAAIVPIMVAVSLAVAMDFPIPWTVVAAALLASLFIQVGTNLFNDVIDFKKGADTKERLGPKRVTQSGAMSAKKVWILAIGCFAAAVLFGIPLVLQGGLPIVYIGILSLFCGYLYTGGPYPLAYKGLGDLFVILFFGLVAVCGMMLLITGQIAPLSYVAGVQVGSLATVLIAINNARDAKTDAKVNKKTLAVRFGHRFILTEITTLVIGALALGGVWFLSGFTWAGVLPLVMAIPYGLLLRELHCTEPGTKYNAFLAKAGALHIGFGLLLTAGLILDSFY